MTEIEPRAFLIKQRGIIKGKLTVFNKFLEEWTIEKGIKTLKLHTDRLPDLWKSFQDIQFQICGFDEESEILAESERFEKKYYFLLEKALNLLEEHTSSPPPSPLAQAEIKPFAVKLPKIELTKFDGDYSDWINFSNLFKALVSDNLQLSDVQKLCYLKSSLKGSAAELIASLALTDSNFKVAWDLLVQRYSNKNLAVNHIVQNLLSIKKLEKESRKELRNLLDKVQRDVQTLGALEQPIEHWDVLLIHIIVSKLDYVTGRAWQLEHASDVLPTYKQLVDFLAARCRMLENMETMQISQPKQPSNTLPKSRVKSNQFFTSKTFVATIKQCSLCKNRHPLFLCEQFKAMTVPQRITHVEHIKACANCLRTNHSIQNCKSMNCRLCNNRHHSLLHQPPTQPEPVFGPSNIQITNVAIQPNKHVLLSTAVINIKHSNGTWVKARCLLDMASQTNLITKSLAESLELDSTKANLSILSVNNTQSQVLTSIEAEIKSEASHTYCKKLVFYQLPVIAGQIPTVALQTSHFYIPEDLKLADSNYATPSEIQILLGAEVFWDILLPGKYVVGTQCPTLQETKLGWICTGILPALQQCRQAVCQLNLTQTLEQLLERFWKLEDLTDPAKPSSLDSECEALFQKTVKRKPSGRYSVALPFRGQTTKLGSSKQVALKRMHFLEHKMSKQTRLSQQYSQFMREYETLGHMSPIEDTTLGYFIPHFEVLRESESTPLRVVFDASQKTNKGISLNEMLQVGPIIQDDLQSLLLRFRYFNYVLSGDIKQFFRQVEIHSPDRAYQKIFWRDNTQQQMQVYQLNTVTYGMVSSPYLATRALKQLFLDEGHKYPLAEGTFTSFYMDNYIHGQEDKHSAIQLRLELTELLQEGKFHICKWISNDADIMSSIPEEDRSKQSTLDFEQEVVNTLGLKWTPLMDTFHFENKQQTTLLTKRSIVSQIARIFDPLGLIGPIITTAKVFMQQLWRSKVSWDEQIPHLLQLEWNKFTHSLIHMSDIQIPRCLKTADRVQDMQVHIFADASMKAYGACAYLRTEYIDKSITVRLIASKSKVAPLKTVSLPRLELNAALIAVQLSHKIASAISQSISVQYYTDSQIVLAWLKKEPCLLKTFVANRVAKIQQETVSNQWTHVKSSENPADLLSRGCTPLALTNSALWWTGPTWLSLTKDHWPHVELEKGIELPEVKTLVLANVTKSFPDIMHQYSSFSKLQRVLAYCFRFIQNCKLPKDYRNTSSLTVDELNKSRHWIFAQVQQQAFPQELKALKEHKTIENRSRLKTLNPFLDNLGLIRVGGRIHSADFPEMQAHPIILPNKHYITSLLIMSEHLKNLHANVQLLLSILRETVWIPQARATIRSVLTKCITCFRTKPKLATQLMGQYPKDRIICNRPFLITGVDYSGPWFIKETNRKNAKLIKAYIAHFVCFSTKANHLELIRDLTAESFINGLKRFISRRGRCSKIYSDNASNFVGAARQLVEMKQMFQSEQFKRNIQDAAASEHIDWQWIPPYAAHHGGLWEAAVKQCKHHLRRVMGQNHYTYEELNTLIIMVEACLNSRPLMPLSEDADDLQALTPAHFLIGESLKAIPEANLTKQPENRLNHWQQVTKMFQKFWKLWSNYYLRSLQARNKWNKQTCNLKIGDLVLISEPNSPPITWKLGRVQTLHPGPDNLVRVVTLHTNKGLIKRAINQLALLPLY